MERDGAPRAVSEPWRLYTPARRAGLLAVLFLVGVSGYVDRNVIGVLLEPIKREFRVSDTMLGLLSGLSFAVFYATLGLPVARLADRGNRKRIIVAALLVWTVMTALCGLAANFVLLALARVGVGAGEAGAVPPGQSLIADYYPPERRSGAIGVFMLSAMAGNVIGLIFGGWVAQHYGWRLAFIAVAAPGLLLALAAALGLDEPRVRPGFAVQASGAEAAQPRETMLQAAHALLAKPSYRDLVVAMILYWLMAYGALIFTPSLMVRTLHVGIAQAGAVFGTISATSAVVGTLVSSVLADRLVRRGAGWLARLPGIALILAMPTYQAAYLMPTLPLMAAMLFVGGLLLTAAVPPMFTALHVVCGSSRRATAVAIAFFFANLIGLGFGPLISGALSDAFAHRFGVAQGLRYALVTVMITFLPCGLFLLRAAGRIEADAEA